MELTIGKRIAQLRHKQGLTQAAVATRCAISRVAISHIEMDLSLPSERTITLLAGLFRLSPLDLVADTTYPAAKAARLPARANWYSQLDLLLALLENDLSWLARLDQPDLALEVRNRWWSRLQTLRRECVVDQDQAAVDAALKALQTACAPPHV